MAEMARHGQVIYLTHHEHLCEIASEVTGGRARIHRLPQRSLMPQTWDSCGCERCFEFCTG